MVIDKNVSIIKAVAIAHYSLIVNVIQWCIHHKANEEYTEWSNRRYRPGDVAIGGGYLTVDLTG